MRITRDKLNKLAHTVADTLADIDQVDFLEDRNTIRQEARKALEQLLMEETKIDQAARLKISSQASAARTGNGRRPTRPTSWAVCWTGPSSPLPTRV